MPGPDEGPWKTAFRRLELMFWSLICPEMIILWAFRQWFAARNLRDEYGGLGWTKTHGYFLQMGGFMLMDGDKRKGVLTHVMFHKLLQEGKVAFPSITEEEIEDRSKADSLTKGIAVLQTTWFIAHRILYFLWWNKPLDIKCCVPVFLLNGDCKPVEIPPFEPKRWAWGSFGMFRSVERWFFKSPGTEESTVVSLLMAAHKTAKVPHSIPQMGIITLATTCALRVTSVLLELLHLPIRAIAVFVSRLGDLLGCDMVDEDALWVPTFYAPPIDDRGEIGVLITTVIIGSLFGGIHCAGWNFPFPSHTELVIWRVSSLIIVIVLCTFVPIFVAAFMNSMDTINKIYFPWFILCFFGIVFYVLARLTLFVEALTALRHLPPGAYAVVEWTAFLLHM